MNRLGHFFIAGFAYWMATTIYADTECPYKSNTPQDTRIDPTRLRLVQYNVEWLFMDYYGGADCPGNGCPWKNDSEASTHMDYVADVVRQLNPDLIHLCEVEGCDELHTLAERIEDGNYTAYLKKGTDTSTGQNVGLLSRIRPLTDLYRTDTKVAYPIPNSTCGYTGLGGTSGVSKHLIAEFPIRSRAGQRATHPSRKGVLIGAHLLAIPTDPTRCAEREAQAQVLQYVIAEYWEKQYDIIVMGDFNDYDAEVSDINENQPISQVLDILKGQRGEKAGTYELTSVAEQIPLEERYSDWWDSDDNCQTQSSLDYSMIDHILLSPSLLSAVQSAFIYHGYEEFCGKYNSDHYPVVVDFAFTP